MTHDRRYDEQMWLIASLQDPRSYDHEVEHVELVETHISYVLLTGEFAYKIKKSVDLGFLDFSDLEKRRHFCCEEVRLNRRTAPQLYLKVVPVGGTPGRPRVGGAGEPVEYAVKMRQFPAHALANRMLARGELAAAHMDEIAALVADFHGRVEAAGADSPFGSPEQVHRPVIDNYETIGGLLRDDGELKRLAALRRWSELTFKTLRPCLEARRRDGFVRECHGDLHLGNLVCVNGRMIAFDCIEFNAELRWIDVMSEAAFLTMDLEDHGRRDYAWRFFNGYLEHTGDYAGTAVLAYYQAYRAMVRAKISRIRLDQPGLPGARRHDLERDYQGYIQLAEKYTRPPSPALYITCGLSRSGKSTVALALSEALGAVRIRSDVERKRLFGLAAGARSRSPLRQGLYDHEATERTYERLHELATTVLRSGHSVIVDATFLNARYRARFRRLAAERGVPFAIIETRAPYEELLARLARRLHGERDPSEADRAVLDNQIRTRSPVGPEERPFAVTVDTAETPSVGDLLHRLEAVAGRGGR